jgi:hypothetical protein
MTLKDNYASFVESIKTLDYREIIEKVNTWFNVNIEYGRDIFIYGKKEYWASLDETLEHGAGDCDDIAIAKYQTLKALGLEPLLVVCEGGTHMVCKCKGYVLDCKDNDMYKLINGILFQFNDQHLFASGSDYDARKHLSQWDALLSRVV